MFASQKAKNLTRTCRSSSSAPVVCTEMYGPPPVCKWIYTSWLEQSYGRSIFRPRPPTRRTTRLAKWQASHAPSYLIRGHDCISGVEARCRLRNVWIREKPNCARLPRENGLAERLIKSIRCECVKRFIIFGEAHLRRVLAGYATYHNQMRIHLILRKDAPSVRAVQRVGRVVIISVLWGLHHHMLGYDFWKG